MRYIFLTDFIYAIDNGFLNAILDVFHIVIYNYL